MKNNSLGTKLLMAAVTLALAAYFGFQAVRYFSDPLSTIPAYNYRVEEAVAEVKLRSRQYAKRQLTWLRRNAVIHWIEWEKQRNFERALQLSTEILTAAGVS